jgi:hypothetical protein
MPAARVVAAAVVGAVALAAPAPPAWASAGASDTPSGGGQVAANAGIPPASTVGPDGSSVGCTYQLLNHPNDPSTPQAPAPQPAPNADEYVQDCGGGAVAIVWVVPPTPADAVPGALADVERLLPHPSPRMDPPNNDPRGWAYVQSPLWWWLPAGQWRPVSATASVTSGPFTASATVTAMPSSITFDPGDGSLGSGPVSCPGPGVPFDNSRSLAEQSSPCTYTYQSSSSMNPDGSGTWAATFTVVWHVAWVGAGGGGGALADLDTTTPVALPVGEVQALGTDPNSQSGGQ